ncbi:MAG: hypothetical protein HY273_17225 [Gammaproteobacteria bacterium]|nr:hypothetical protein [Gammaproteobacteria bacterium]
MRNFPARLSLWMILVLGTLPALADDADMPRKMRALDEQTQSLKREVLELGRNIANLAWVGGVKPAGDPADKNTRFNLKTLSDETVRMGQSLTRLEDGVLAPPGIQLVVFASLDAGDGFELREITLNVDDKLVARRSYQPGEVAALLQGGAHRLYIGGLPEGAHHLSGTVVAGGKAPKTSSFSARFTKAADRKTIELRISSFLGNMSVTSKEWD